MEDEVAFILQEEREEMALRKAEMEATKAENMIAHKDEIFSRPKKTWFVTEREKRVVAKAAKASTAKDKGSAKDVISAQEAEDLRMKEKRKQQLEKNLPRRKRRKLEAAREMLEEDVVDKSQEGAGKNTKEKAGLSLVDLAYRRAKAVKAVRKAQDAGKIIKKGIKKQKSNSQRTQSRTEEMQELFQSDMGDKQQKRISGGGIRKKKSKNSFKSKSRYKRK